MLFTELLLLSPAMATVVRVVTREDITSELRDSVALWASSKRGLFRQKLSYLIGCPFCTSTWLSALLLAFLAETPVGWLYGTLVLTFLTASLVLLYDLALHTSYRLQR